MNTLESLPVGAWSGTSTLQDPHAGIAETSPSEAAVTRSPDGIRLDYTWAYRDNPQHGSILLSVEGQTVRAQWTDTWHTGNKPMACSGPAGETLSVRGSYPAPPGPDWGWRIDLMRDGEKMRMVMWNVWPAEQGGKEELAVEAWYDRR